MGVITHVYKLYRTENISINGIPHTVRFSIRDDGLEHTLFVINDINGKRAKGKYSKYQAKNFNTLNNEALKAKAEEVMANHFQNECFDQ